MNASPNSRTPSINAASLLLALLAAAAMAAPARAQATATAADPFVGIPNRMQQFIDQHEMAGAVTLVAHNGKIVHLGAAGSASVEDKKLMTTDAIFGIMSMTKPISATALMILVDEGKVSVDDPVAKYIPEFTGAKLKDGTPVKDLRVRHLLTHTSGLGGDQAVRGSLAETAVEISKRGFDFQPGERWQYGPSINVIGRIVEVASGAPFEQFVVERILNPLGMKDTSFHPNVLQLDRIVQLYETTADKEFKLAKRFVEPMDPTVPPNPSGGLFSTASDMAKFYSMVLNGGELDGKRILSADAVKAMTAVETGEIPAGFIADNKAGYGWGYGWCVVKAPKGVSEALNAGSFGHGGAYGTQGWVDPVNRTIYVLMVQRSNFPNSDASDVRREFQRLARAALETTP